MEEIESNPWPTFVDAFSTVLCIFIFLMLIFVLNSMLIMNESSKKYYMTEANASRVSLSPSVGEDNSESEPNAQENPGEVGQDIQALASAVKAGDAIEQAKLQSSQTVVALAEKQGSENHTGKDSGRFETNSSSVSAYEIKNNRFIIHFSRMEQGYSLETMNKLSEWLKLTPKKPTSVAVYNNMASEASVSDSMRLAYQRGIILLKTIKDIYPSQEVSISVINDSSSMNNSAVITRSEQ